MNEKTYRRKLMKVGGSVVVPLPKRLRNSLGIGQGDYVEISLAGVDGINIKREKKPWHGHITKKD